MSHVFCTYFDQFYLTRALALYSSLTEHAPDFRLYALCMDDAAMAKLQSSPLPNLTPISLRELEAWDPRLGEAKQNRSRIEYYFTCTAALCRYVLDRVTEAKQVTYLDADLFFFSDPSPIFEELEGASIGIIEHRFSRRSRRLARYGIYNVGWLTFRRDDNALACLSWWHDRCLEWCYDRPEPDRFADQKYLDDWPDRFAGVHVIRNRGANVAGWNISNYSVRRREGRVFIDDEPLVFFHFAGFKEIRSWLFKTNFGAYPVYPSRIVRKEIFGRYISALAAAGGSEHPARTNRTQKGRLSLFGSLQKFERFVRGLIFREYILFLKGRVL